MDKGILGSVPNLLKLLSELAIFIPPEIDALKSGFVVLFRCERSCMMFIPVGCPTCQRTDVVQYGQTPHGTQRLHCRNRACQRPTFLVEYPNTGFLQEVKNQIVDMARNGSGIRDTARVLNVSPTTVIATLKTRTRAARWE
jgi:transposase-like protein